MGFPPGFALKKEDLDVLWELIKEGANLVPLEHQEAFVESVDNAEDDEIMNFFKEKFKVAQEVDTNYQTFHNVRRSHRIKKKPARLADSIGYSGLRRGFLND